VVRGLTRRVSQRTGERSKALKASASSWRIRATGCREDGQRHEGNGGRRARAASHQGKTLKREPWTWLRGETNPRRLAEEKTVEDVRNVEDGTKRAWDARVGGLRQLSSR
jgi:hypothetical protein